MNFTKLQFLVENRHRHFGSATLLNWLETTPNSRIPLRSRLFIVGSQEDFETSLLPPSLQIIFNQRATEEQWWKSMHAQLRSNEHPAIRMMSLLSPSMWKMNRYGVAASRYSLLLHIGQFSACAFSNPNPDRFKDDFCSADRLRVRRARV